MPAPAKATWAGTTRGTGNGVEGPSIHRDRHDQGATSLPGQRVSVGPCNATIDRSGHVDSRAEGLWRLFNARVFQTAFSIRSGPTTVSGCSGIPDPATARRRAAADRRHRCPGGRRRPSSRCRSRRARGSPMTGLVTSLTVPATPQCQQRFRGDDPLGRWDILREAPSASRAAPAPSFLVSASGRPHLRRRPEPIRSWSRCDDQRTGIIELAGQQHHRANRARRPRQRLPSIRP